MYLKFFEKEEKIRQEFLKCTSQEEIYRMIISYGKKLEPFPDHFKNSEHLVTGCQSIMYLHAEMKEGRVLFQASSDALISKGLAALLIELYQGETPETIIKTFPTLLDQIGVQQSLTPGRANGLASLYLKMKQQALKFLLNN